MHALARCTLLGAAWVAPLPALAHAVLVDSTPAPQGHVPAGKLAIALRYNSRIDAGRCKLTLTAPDAAGGSATTRLATHGQGAALLTAAIGVAPGDYTLHWQVLAIDGHITRGNVPFTVDAATAPGSVAGAR